MVVDDAWTKTKGWDVVRTVPLRVPVLSCGPGVIPDHVAVEPPGSRDHVFIKRSIADC